MDSAEYSLRKKIIKGEGQHLDFKFAVNDSRKIARSMSAFANADGGSLLLGVKDNGKIAGIRSEEEYFMVESAATVFCKPTISFETILWEIEGKEVLEIVVSSIGDELIEAPAEDGVYHAFYRQDDQNHVVSDIFVEVWKKRQLNENIDISDMKLLRERMCFFEIEGGIDLARFSELSGMKIEKAREVLIELLLLGYLDFFYTEKGEFYVKVF